MQPLELIKDLLEHELLRESVSFNLSQCYIMELTALRGKDVVIPNVAVVYSALSNYVS
jgi:hypothetical protein